MRLDRGRQLDPPANEMAPHMLAQMKSRELSKERSCRVVLLLETKLINFFG